MPAPARPAIRSGFAGSLLALLLTLVPITAAWADALRVAVAASFRPVLAPLADAHAKATGDRIDLVVGSTGMLYAQIVAGAPFDLFLAADAERPRLLEAADRIVPGTRRSYARGRLALWANGRAVSGAASLDDLGPGRFAIADPTVAPFGRAALETIAALDRMAGLERRIVRGHSVGQAYQFVASGAAAAGLVAASQVSDRDPSTWWLVPESLHAPVDQQLVLLRDTPGGRRMLAYLATDEVREAVAAAGFDVPPR